MQKNIPVKISRKYLNNIIPENLFLPLKPLTKKQKFFFSEKFKKSALKKSLNLIEKKLSNLFIKNHKLDPNRDLLYKVSKEALRLYTPIIPDAMLTLLSSYSKQSVVKQPIANIIIAKHKDYVKHEVYSQDFKKPINEITTISNILLSKKKKLYYSLDQFFFELTKKQASFNKLSEFAVQQKERKKLAYIYGGLSKKQLYKIFEKAKDLEGSFAENSFKILESRLDATLVRACFFKNIFIAKQWISHKKILVNNKTVNIPGYLLQPGDVIAIKKRYFIPFARSLKIDLKKTIKKRNNRTLLHNQKLFLLSPLVAFARKATKAGSGLPSKMVETPYSKQLLVKKYDDFLQPRYIVNVRKSFQFFIKSLLMNTVIIVAKPKKTKNLQAFYSLTSIIKKKKQIIYSNIFFTFIKKIQTHPFFCSTNFFFLQFKKFLKRKKDYKEKLMAMRYSSMKPIHLEISYKVFTIIYLYSPQKISFLTSIDFDLIYKSFK